MTDHKSTEGLREVMEELRAVKISPRKNWLDPSLNKLPPYWRGYFQTLAFSLLVNPYATDEQVRAELIAAIEAKLSAKQ